MAVHRLDDELADLDARLLVLLNTTAPDLLDVIGVGPDTASCRLSAIASEMRELTNELGFARAV